MTRLVRLAALGLELREREIVLGDLEEYGLPGARAFFEVLGLAVRRQARIWTSWRPWFALIGVAGISGFYLSRMLAELGMKIAQQLGAWRHFGVHYNMGVTSFRDDVIYMCCLAAAIFCWMVVNASVLRRFSGRALWLTGFLFYVVVHDSAMAWAILSGNVTWRGNPSWWIFVYWLLPPANAAACFFILLFVVPVVCGALGRFPRIVPVTVLCTIAAALLGEYHAHDLERLSGGAFRPDSWAAILAPYALVSWPVFLVPHRGPRA